MNILRKVTSCNQIFSLKQMQSRFSSIYTPDYLHLMEPKFPMYPALCVQIRGYDFPVLELYHKLVNKIADQMDFDVEGSYAIPPQQFKIVKYKPMTSVSDIEFKLNMYERNTIVSNVSSIHCPIFIRVLEAALPPGVQLDVMEYTDEKDLARYIPDKQLIDLKTELDDMYKKK